MAIEEQLIELMGEFEPDKWYIIRPTSPLGPIGLRVLGEVFRREKPGGIGGILILANHLHIENIEYYFIRDTLKAFRINIDILHALYRQIKWRPWVRIRGLAKEIRKWLVTIESSER